MDLTVWALNQETHGNIKSIHVEMYEKYFIGW